LTSGGPASATSRHKTGSRSDKALAAALKLRAGRMDMAGLDTLTPPIFNGGITVSVMSGGQML
jgi:hypothetical protein